MSKKFKISEAIDAIEKNGYKKTKGAFWRETATRYKYTDDPEKAIYACAVGQGALNLGVLPHELERSLHPIRVRPNGWDISLAVAIENLNDQTSMSVRNIAKRVRKMLTQEQLDTVIDIAT